MITAVAFDLDGTLLDHGRAAGDAVRGWVAARGWQVPEDVAGHWLKLEREHFGAFTSGAISFEEQRRRRVRAFVPLVSSAGVLEEDPDDARSRSPSSPASACSTGSRSWLPPASCPPGNPIPGPSPSYASA